MAKVPTVYPSYDIVIRVHKEIIQRSDGEQGIVSLTNLAYTLDAAKDIGENLPDERSVIRKSGYLLFNLINLHPFLDGNKRTAFEVTKNFLQLNGWSWEPGEDDAFTMLVSMAKGASDVESVEDWVARDLSRSRSQR